MKQEDKELLLKDLCARLPYGVKVYGNYSYSDGDKIVDDIETKVLDICDIDWAINNIEIKPYLFPLESMTEKMLEELNENGFFKYRNTIANVSHLESKTGISKEIYTYIDIESISFLTEFFHSNHVDYIGLIPKELAIDATNLNIY